MGRAISKDTSFTDPQLIDVNIFEDIFSGDGSTTAFGLSVAPASASALLVIVDNVILKLSEYTVTGTTLTIPSAPSNSTDNVVARHVGERSLLGTPDDTTVSEGKLSSDLLAQRLPSAWVNFNGSGGAVIADSYNVSGVVKDATGEYTITFSTPMTNANYVAIGNAGVLDAITLEPVIGITNKTTTTCKVYTGTNTAAADRPRIDVIIFGGK